MYLWFRRTDRLLVRFLNPLPTSIPNAGISGAQIAVAALAVNFFVDQGVGISQAKASELFSFCQITFTFGR